MSLWNDVYAPITYSIGFLNTDLDTATTALARGGPSCTAA